MEPSKVKLSSTQFLKPNNFSSLNNASLPNYRWYKFMEMNNNKKLVKLDSRVQQVGGTLIIKEAKVEDSGKYLCMVNNSVGGESVETVLTVTGTGNVKGCVMEIKNGWSQE